MSDSGQLLVLAGKYLNGELSLAELATWIQDREEYWVTLPRDSIARVLTGTIMLATYEVDAGDRDPDSVKELISEAMLDPALHD
jgi:hypothetical protein